MSIININYTISIIIALSFLVTPFFVFAQVDAGEVRDAQTVQTLERAGNLEKPVNKRESFLKRVQSRFKRDGAVKPEDAVRDVRQIDKPTRALEQRGAAQDRVKEERDEKRERVAQRRAEQQKLVSEKRKERIRAYFGKMFTRIEAAILRLDTLADRIASRIQKFEDRDIDVEKAQQLLSDARSLIEQAKQTLADARGSIENILNNENPKEIFALTRNTIKSVVTHIKEAHRALVESIVALKGAVSETSKEDSEE